MPPEPPPPPPPPPLPYDEEVEYIESTGSEYLDTGITITGNFEMTLVFALTGTNAQYRKLCGLGNDATGRYQYCKIQCLGTSNSEVGFANGDTDFREKNFLLDSEIERHTAVIRQIDDQTTEVMLDGVTATINNSVTASRISSGKLFIAAMNYCLNSSGSGRTSTPVAFTMMRIYAFTFKQNGQNIASMKPVKKDGGGYMFDELSATMIGSGDFLPGPQKA